MPKVNKDVKKAFIQTILGHFPKDKPDLIKNLIKNKTMKLKGKNVVQKK